MFEMLEPIALPRASEERPLEREAMMTASWKSDHQKNLWTPIQEGVRNYLLPFCASSEQGDQGRRYSETPCDDRCVVDEFVGADVEEDDCGDEGAGVENYSVPVHCARVTSTDWISGPQP